MWATAHRATAGRPGRLGCRSRLTYRDILDLLLDTLETAPRLLAHCAAMYRGTEALKGTRHAGVRSGRDQGNVFHLTQG